MVRLLNGLFAALFALGAVVQYNDPDPLRWMLLYLAASVTCLLGAMGRLRWPMPAGVALVSLACAARLTRRVVGEVGMGELVAAWEMKDARVEEGREMYGLLMIAAWMIVLTVAEHRKSRRASGSSVRANEAR